MRRKKRYFLPLISRLKLYTRFIVDVPGQKSRNNRYLLMSAARATNGNFYCGSRVLSLRHPMTNKTRVKTNGRPPSIPRGRTNTSAPLARLTTPRRISRGRRGRRKYPSALTPILHNVERFIFGFPEFTKHLKILLFHFVGKFLSAILSPFFFFLILWPENSAVRDKVHG